jgi:hypothetical protein
MCKVEMTPATDGPLSAVKESIGKRLLCLADLSAEFFFIVLGFLRY